MAPKSLRGALVAWMPLAWAPVALIFSAVSCQVGAPRVRPVSRAYLECTDEVALEMFEKAVAEVRAGAVLDAVPRLREVVTRCPDFIDGHMRYQDAAIAASDAVVETSMREFYTALALTDSSSSPVVPYLRSRLAEDDSEKLPLLESAIERDGSFYHALLDKGKILRRLDRRTGEALDALQRAVSAQPTCPQANIELAQVLNGLGRGDEAREHFEAYLASVPDDLETKRHYIRLLIYDLGDLDRAERLNRSLLDSDEDDAVAWMDRAAIAWQRGETEGARDAYRRVLRIDPTRDRAALNLGNLYFQVFAGDTEEGRRQFWPKARAAYRYFLGLQRAEGLADVVDTQFSVPYRLDDIAAFLGPDDVEREPSLDDF